MPTPTSPRTGPCAPWVTARLVQEQPTCSGITPNLAARKATVASELLWDLSGQQFTGICGPVTVRPMARPVDIDTRAMGRFVAAGYYSASWGSCFAYGMPHNGAWSSYGCTRPPEIDLGTYPVVQITEVRIDGVLIPPTEYELQNWRTLVRLRTSASSTPTQRWGWPTCQILDLPLTTPGTFGVTFKYGMPPPQSGIDAAAYLAAQMARQEQFGESDLPQRLVSMTREGVTMNVTDSMDFLRTGLTGMYPVDLFLRAVNPYKVKRRPLVWSPDMGRARRMPQG